MQIVIDMDDRCIPQNARPIDWIKSAYENPSKCKITVLPKHGRLIDADAIRENECNKHCNTWCFEPRMCPYIGIVERADTILESNMVEPQKSEE